MKKTLAFLLAGFESSCSLTPEFAQFFRTFKSEFTKELKSIGATNIIFSRGHFYVSGFYTIGIQAWYFSISDVRGMDYGLCNYPDRCMSQLLYRTAQHYKDYTGGYNRYVKIETGMAQNMK